MTVRREGPDAGAEALPDFDGILRGAQAVLPHGECLGFSRERRPIIGYRFGSGGIRVSLIAGCHADEPVGPRMLRSVAAWLSGCSQDAPCHSAMEWWIVPDMNPDGARRNAAWAELPGEAFDLATYLHNVVREAPGDDIEFGFPRDESDHAARSENRAVWKWWQTAPRSFDVHVSFHGMAFAGGPWFLIDPAWAERCEHVKQRCRTAVAALGYVLHDVQRHGEKGFVRLERGFSTRPSVTAMKAYFTDREDTTTAALFRPSSMETIRDMGGDPLTLVSEVPLFVIPGVGNEIEPDDPVARRWRGVLEDWRRRLQGSPDDTPDAACVGDIQRAGIRPMPIVDQMRLQWTLFVAGLEQVLLERTGTPRLPPAHK